jgi:hypothetical protein
MTRRGYDSDQYELSWEAAGPEVPEHGLRLFATGQEALPLDELQEPEILFKPGAEGSDTEWFKPEYHGLQTDHFADFSPADVRRFSEYLTPEGISRSLYWTRQVKPFMFYWSSPSGKTEHWIPVRREEAFHLGIDRPLLLGRRAVQSALETESALELPPLLKPPIPRFYLVNAYHHQHIRRKFKAARMLHDTMRLRNSNGEYVRNEDRLGLARTVRTDVLHPMVMVMADAEGLDGVETRKLRQALDYKLFFEGTKTSRTPFIRDLLRDARAYLEKLDDIFANRVRFARKYPGDPALEAVARLALESSDD